MTAPRKRVERVIRFPKPLYARLKRESARSGLSANAITVQAVERHLDAEAERAK